MMRGVKLFAGIVIAQLTLAVGFSLPAAAIEQIESYFTDVTITKDNVARVTETIVYNFDTEQKHGIYRDIPIDLRDGSDTYYFTLNYDKTLDQAGTPVEAKLTTQNGQTRIRLGDPDATVTGIHTYKISYSLSPIIYLKDSVPFFNLDVVGTGFDVPMRSAAARITFPSSAKLTNALCFQGSAGSNTPCTLRQNKPNVLETDAVSLRARQGVTVNASLQDGVVSPYLVANQKRPFSWVEFWPALLSVLAPLLIFATVAGVFFVIFLRWARARRLRKDQTVVAQYDPPKTLSPAEIGYLIDDTTSTPELTATVIDLARKEHLHIKQLDKPSGVAGWFSRQDYLLTKTESTGDTLNDFEQTLYTGLFSEGDEVKLSKLPKGKMAIAVASFEEKIKKSLTDKGYYDKSGGLIRRGNLTETGAKEWALVDGFRLFIEVVEKDRLAFSDAPEKTPERFNELLPYAIALGVEKQWAKQFEGINVEAATDWYEGSGRAFSAAAFTSAISGGFASSLASNSSISSGGGASGGGGGGGGGGSW